MRRSLLLLLLITLPAFSASPVFRVLVKSKYNKNWFKITQEGKKWVCETNHVPYYEASENPLASLDWSALEKESTVRPKNCAELVGFENALSGKEKRVVSCLSQKETLSLYGKISSLCRAKI